MAKRPHLTGVYAIELMGSDRFYIGSSSDIGSRWTAHRRDLTTGKHVNARLRNAWAKYGEAAFRMLVLEECDRADLIEREQAYIDGLQPWFNLAPKAGLLPPITPEFIARLRARTALITACPRGHAYDEANTYRGKAGKRICRVCNALRVSGVYAVETPEQRETRRQAVKAHYEANKPQISAQMREYAAARKEEKRAYDVNRRALANQQRRERHAAESHEQRSIRLAKRRELEGPTWAEQNRKRRDRLKEATS